MRILVLSDLHIEFAPFVPSAADIDVVVLAGDIGVGAPAILWAGTAFADKPVICVLGNHEFYRGNIEETWEDMRRAGSSNMYLLENQTVTIDGVRFLGCTLWTDYALFGPATQLDAMARADEGLADHRLITIGAAGSLRRYLPKDALTTHVRSRRWLESELARAHEGPTVVVTHHAPHRGSVASRYQEDMLTPAFASDLGYLMGKADVWLHGHMHDSFDYAVDGTRIVCNPRGYPLRTGEFENPAFSGSLVVTVS